VNKVSLRKEFKFFGENIQDVLSSLGPYQVSRAASEIHTTYFDTIDLRNLRNSMDGQDIRVQYRFRYYGSKNDKKAEESGKLHIKTTTPFGDYKVHLDTTRQNVENMLTIRVGQQVRKFMVISYRRQYFKNSFGMRITLDSNIRSNYIGARISSDQSYIWSSNVLEIKLPFLFEDRADQIFKLTSKEARFSKIERAAELAGLVQ
jgi:hypothetical protein